jgi:hypothetical protein
MHLRHLIVLIIDARDAGTRSCNRGLGLGLERNFAMPHGTAFLIGQIKLTRIHVAPLLSPGYGSNKQKSHLFTMSKDPAAPASEDAELPNLLSVCDDILRVGIGGADRDRTDDLKLAKLPLSQLSYGPLSMKDGGPG